MYWLALYLIGYYSSLPVVVKNMMTNSDDKSLQYTTATDVFTCT